MKCLTLMKCLNVMTLGLVVSSSQLYLGSEWISERPLLTLSETCVNGCNSTLKVIFPPQHNVYKFDLIPFKLLNSYGVNCN